MTDTHKLEIVKTLMQWKMETEEEKLNILNRIWFVVVEDKELE